MLKYAHIARRSTKFGALLLISLNNSREINCEETECECVHAKEMPDDKTVEKPTIIRENQQKRISLCNIIVAKQCAIWRSR